jgi:hypothetical protein
LDLTTSESATTATDVSRIAKLAEVVSTAKKRWRMALIPEFVDQGWSVTRAIGYNPTIRLDLVPVGVMPLTGCLLGADILQSS